MLRLQKIKICFLVELAIYVYLALSDVVYAMVVESFTLQLEKFRSQVLIDDGDEFNHRTSLLFRSWRFFVDKNRSHQPSNIQYTRNERYLNFMGPCNSQARLKQ